jgi:hypothetical protein
VSEELAATPVSTFGSEQLSLLAILALVVLWISGAFGQLFPPAVPARPPTIRLGPPMLVAMSAGEEASAAHLLGSSVAALMAADGPTG